MGESYAHTYESHRAAMTEMYLYYKSNKDEIERYDRMTGIVLCKNGDRHYFMSFLRYKSWCKGREYILDGKRYESGLLVTIESEK